MKEQK